MRPAREEDLAELFRIQLRALGFEAMLDSGFKINHVLAFCASHPERFGDPRRYIPMAAALY